MINDPSAPPRGGVGSISVKSGGLTRRIHIFQGFEGNRLSPNRTASKTLPDGPRHAVTDGFRTDKTTTRIPTTPWHAEQYPGTATGTVRRVGYVPTQHSRTDLFREERPWPADTKNDREIISHEYFARGAALAPILVRKPYLPSGDAARPQY